MHTPTERWRSADRVAVVRISVDLSCLFSLSLVVWGGIDKCLAFVRDANPRP